MSLRPPTVDALVEDYLTRLHAAAAALPPDRRADVVDGISEHIAAARAAGAAADEAAVRTLLDRLGQPEEIVAAAREDGEAHSGQWAGGGYGPSTFGQQAYAAPGQPVSSGPAGRPWGGLEITALVLLTVGGFIAPVIGPLVGLVLVCMSDRWTRRQKVIAAVVAIGPVALFVSLGVLVALAPTGGNILAPGLIEVFLLMSFALLGPWAAALYLALVGKPRR